MQDTTTPTLAEQQIDVLERFNYQKVLTVMHALNWTWMGKKVTIEDLKRCGKELTDWVINRSNEADGIRSVSTGGFEARVDEYEFGYRLSLNFIVEYAEGSIY